MVHLLSNLAISLTLGFAQSVHAVFGPIGTSNPNPPGGKIANDQPPNSFFQGRSPPYPTTGDWWVGYAAAAGDAWVAGPFPYQSAAFNDSLRFGVSSARTFDGTSVKQPTQSDYSITFTEHNGAPNGKKALSWDTQTVTLQYFTGSSSFTGYMVPGSPYLTFRFDASTPKIISQNGAITTFGGLSVGATAVTATGTKFKVVNSAGTYIIYSLNGSITLSATSTTITGSGRLSGVLRVAKLDTSSHESTLDNYVANYATGVTTDYTFSGDTATLIFTWNVIGSATNLLQLTWPHHRISMTNGNFLSKTAISYLTTKGYMLGMLGNVWRMNYPLTTITWNAPRAPHSSCTASILQGLEYEVSALIASAPPAVADFYWWGGAIAAKARLALIADHLGRTDLRNQVVTWLKAAFDPWFAASSLMAYETGWGGIINKAGYNNVWVDYGNGYYNDHHFHYGYVIAIAATIAKFDSAWLNAHREVITYFVRDIANPSTGDGYFTPTRNRDWFAGHSWASGIAGGAGPRDQESVGEAVNGYYGVLLWADVVGNADLKNYARLLLATEQQAAKVYWHMYPNADGQGRDQPYPEAGLRNLVTIGNVMDWQSGAWLFWGAQRVQILAIQILPVIPVNEVMYDAEWIRAAYSYAAPELNDTAYGDEWKSVIYAAYAQADPQTAALRSGDLGDWGTGNTYTNQLYFVSTRPNPSGAAICTTAAANPTGRFTIREVSTNRYLTSSASRVEVFADGTAGTAATQYEFAFAPGGGTIKGINNGQFVTADSSGSYNIAAARAVAGAWEKFVVRPRSSGVYTIQASSNKKYLVVGADGSIKNSGATAASATGFALTSSGSVTPTVPSSAMLRHVATGQFVSVGTPLTDPYIRTVSGSSGTMWEFPDLTDSAGATVKGIREQDNQLYVTSDEAGAQQLQAFRQIAMAWEFFTVELSGCQVAFKLQINGKYIGVRSDGKLYPDQTSTGTATMFQFVGGTTGAC